MDKKLKQFVLAYIETLLWSEGEIYDENENCIGMFDEYDLCDIALCSVKEMVCDCKSFIEEIEAIKIDMKTDYIAHNFCLTRNGHGTGFWDRGLGDLGDRLTDMCKPYGGQNLYMGDDKKLYVMY
jgi:hypothetical protein